MIYPVGVCANCEEENRVLKYARKTMCCKYSCQRAAHAEVQARKASRGGSASKKEKAAPVFCYKILQICGQRDIDPAVLVGAKRRNKLSDAEMNTSYLVHGEFGETKQDAGFKDFRWVELTDLLNLSDTEMKKVIQYEKKLHERQVAKRQALMEAAQDDE